MILTIDLGTSGPKVSVFNQQAQLIDTAFEEVPTLLTPDHGVEQRPSDWLRAIEACYATIRARGKFQTAEITALNVTSQWSGTVAVDEQGEPLMNAIIWMDARGAKYAQRVMDGPIKIEGYYAVHKLVKWLRLCGGGPSKSGKDSISHILYIKAVHPEIYQRTYKFLEPKDWLNHYFTGKICASFDSITLYWITDNRDIHNIHYRDDLIKTTGVDKNKLPDLVPTNTVLGPLREEMASRWGLRSSVQVISGCPDTHSAAVGSGAVRDGETHLYIGTSSWMICHLPHKRTDIFHNMGTIPSGIPGRFMVVNEQETTGACLQFVKNNILYPQDALSSEAAPADFYKRIDNIAAGVSAGSEGLLFLPWLNGERSPFDEHQARGGFYNLSLHNTRHHMLRAVLEGVALNNSWLLGYLQKLIGQNVAYINFIGGGANSATWSQIQADVMNKPIRQMKEPVTANSRGAALLALLALKKITIDDIPEMVEVNKTYEPIAAHTAIYRERFERYVEIFEKNKAIWRKMN